SQKFVVDPDSGSADFWILSDLCKSNCGDSGTKYKTSSSSAVDANKNFNIQYGAGSTSGKLYRDTAKLGDLTVRNLTIGAASHISSELASDPAGGILGLGFRQITSAGQKTFLDRLFTQEKLKSQVVSFAFGRSAKKTLSKAEMRFGDVNSQLYSGDISYSPVTTKGYWQFGVQSFAAGSGSGINLDSIVDTGTSLIAVEESQAAKFWKDVPNSKFDQEQGYYTYPCSQKINAVLKTKDGKSWPIEEDDFNLGSLTATSDRCVGAVFPAQTRNVVVLGIVFLKNAYSVLDYSQNRVGLA
ncbi:acid protease, partial [Jaminaea rosea]